MIIYLITNDINGKQYVGQTTQSLKRRWMEHIWDTNKGSTYAIHRAIRKYGAEHFHIKEIDIASSRSELNDKEKYWIAKLNTMYPNGYNLVEGGSTPVWTPEIREKVSGNNHWTHRMSFSIETLQKKHDALYRKPSPRSKPVRCVETGEVFPFAKEFYYKYGYQDSKILECCKGRRKTHHNLHWEFVS
jgi:group I intron endonuclease